MEATEGTVIALIITMLAMMATVMVALLTMVWQGRGSTRELSDQIGRQTAHIDAQGVRMEILADAQVARLDTVILDVGELKGEVKVLQNNMNDLKDDVKELQDDVKDLKGDVKELQDDVKDLKGDVKNLDVRVRRVEDRLDINAPVPVTA